MGEVSNEEMEFMIMRLRDFKQTNEFLERLFEGPAHCAPAGIDHSYGCLNVKSLGGFSYGVPQVRHKHNRNHITMLHAGKWLVETLGKNDETKQHRHFQGPCPVNIRAGVRHRITLESIPKIEIPSASCISVHRDFGGNVIEEYAGNDKAWK